MSTHPGKRTTGFAKQADTVSLKPAEKAPEGPLVTGKRVAGFSTENVALETATNRSLSSKEREQQREQAEDAKIEKLRSELNAQAIRMHEDQKRKAEEYKAELARQIAAKKAAKEQEAGGRRGVASTSDAPTDPAAIAGTDGNGPLSPASTTRLAHSMGTARDEAPVMEAKKQRAMENRRDLEAQIAARYVDKVTARQQKRSEDTRTLQYMQQELVASYLIERGPGGVGARRF